MVRKANESDVLKWTSTQQERFWSKIKKGSEDECWEWKGYRERDGYGRYWFGDHKFLAHRTAWVLTHKKVVPPGLVVMHICDNPACCNPNHLKVGTQTQNIADMVQKGRSARGEKNPAVRLAKKDVVAIREKYRSGAPVTKLAAKYGVTETTIYDILTGKTWASVGGPIVKRRSQEEMRGETHPSAKLTERDVVEIRERHCSGGPVSELASEFGVGQATIYDIVAGKTWTHIGGPIRTRSREEPRNEGGPNAKLTEDEVVQIRERHCSGEPISELASEFGVSQTAIRNIVKGRTWRHVGGPIRGQSEVSER